MDRLEIWLAGVDVDPGWLWLASGLSLVLLVAAVVGLPWVLVRLPEDWLVRDAPPSRRHPVVHVVAVVVRNLVGALLVLAGIAMLVLPGQGLLTILAGVMLLDLPGKHRLVVRLLRRPQIRRSVTWIRRKAGRPPLRLPEDEDD